jgi:outer membrane protein OmpA-like peptidoglycan-associated protein
MSLAPFDTYCSEDADQFLMRRWVTRAVVCSLLFHAGLLAVFHFKKLEDFRVVEYEPVARPMVLWRVVDRPEVYESEARVVPTSVASPVLPIPIPIPTAKSEGEALYGSSRPVELPAPTTDFDGASEGPGTSAGLGKSLHDQIRESLGGLLIEGNHAAGDPVAQGPTDPNTLGDVPGQTSLEKAYARTDPVSAEDAPIALSGGALYEYNSSELRPQAIEQLRKLGELIQRNPQANFSIEGHADAVGTPEYNQALSEKRAESVKQWLVQFMGVSPERIETRGFGSSRLLVPGDRTIEEQQLNRRVEIVIKPKR